jgi:sugar lactone lactonase YvrE
VATIAPTSRPVTKQSAPTRYTAHVLLHGFGRPDDLVLDSQNRLLFSDEINGTLNRINTDGSVTVLLHDPAGPEGPVALPDGTIIFSEQQTNRILSLAPNSSTPTLLHTLPGTPSLALCKDGVDGIALDPTTNTIIVPDSPTGTVYRMSLDGKVFTPLASGIVRPTGAGIDDQGNIYIADECGHSIWQISTAGTTTRFGGFGMPDDVIPDGFGNLLIIDLEPTIHALIRFNIHTGQHEILASKGLIEPQGLLTDQQHNIFVSDDYANVILKYTPA